MATKHQDFSPDFKNNQLLNVLLQLLGAEPAAIQGKVFMDTAAGAVKVSLDGSTWVSLATTADLAGAGVSLEVVMDALGTGALVGGANMTLTYDDAANAGEGTVTFDVTGLTSGDLSDFTTAVNSLITTQLNAVVDGAPGALDTLNELAAALQDNPDIIGDILTAQALRTQQHVALYGDGAATSFAIAHNLGTVGPVVSIVEVATGNAWDVPWTVDNANQVTITHSITPTADQFRVTVVGRAD